MLSAVESTTMNINTAIPLIGFTGVAAFVLISGGLGIAIELRRHSRTLRRRRR
jgi:hypothetical protein